MSVFDDPTVRAAIQSAIMDEIDVDSATPVRIRVPDKLIARLEAILAPAMADGVIVTRLQEADAHAAKAKRSVIYLSISPEGIQVRAEACGNHPAYPIFRTVEIVGWRQLQEANINPLLSVIDAAAESAAGKAKAAWQSIRARYFWKKRMQSMELVTNQVMALFADAAEARVEDLERSSQLRSTGDVDSLSLAEFYMQCEEAFGIEIPDRVCAGFKTLGDVIDEIERRIDL